MADTPHFLDSIDVDPADPSSNDPWGTDPEPRYARFEADDAAVRKDAAIDFALDEAHSNARWSRIYSDCARSEANRATIYRDTAETWAACSDIDADRASVSAGSAWLAAETANLSAEIAGSAARSATADRRLAFSLTMFVLGLILGVMLAVLIYLWVIAIAHDAAPGTPGLLPHHGATPTADQQFKLAS